MTSASSQIADMQSALAAVEESMLAASADPREFAKLDSRRNAMNAELARLQMRERVEQREAAQAHRTALADRRDEAREQAAKLRAAGEALELQIEATIALINDQLRRAQELTLEHRKLAGISQNAIDALRHQFKIVGKPEVSSAWVAAEKVVLELWGEASYWLGQAGLRPDDPRALSAWQNRAHRKR